MVAVGSGEAFPLGVSLVPGGANVAVFSSVATAVSVSVFDAAGAETSYPLRQADNDIWHGFIAGLGPGQEYGIRVEGPHTPSTTGARCNPRKLLLDPYGRSITGNLNWRPSWQGASSADSNAPDPTDSAPDAPRSVVCASAFNWAEDRSPAHALADSIIYELHVRGFTQQHPALPPALQGTFAGLAQPAVIEYLQGLGITAVELMPVQQFLSSGVLSGRGLTQYWGYDSISFFAVHAGYSARRRAGDPPGSEIDEFKDMVNALHAADIEVILDVVYNHTAEGDERGGTLCFRGLDNASYYRLVPDALNFYDNLTGCGNTINTGSAAVRRLILDSMRYWVTEFHVDGFRFDLAAVLASEQPGNTADADPIWLDNARFFELLTQDPVLGPVKLIAEPWTRAGDEQGRFPSGWSEWNGQYRDVLRDFWRDQLPAPRWAGARIAGSPDMYANNSARYSIRRQPTASINFVTCHDGYTLADLVSYDHKQNQANQEGNTDGTADPDNRSWNCGQPVDDGPTTNPAIAALRRRQQRNLLATLLISRGVPMILAGDERSRTQGGNNNAYCQDNPTSWVDWTPGADATNLTQFLAGLIHLRRNTTTLRMSRFAEPGPQTASEPTATTGLGWFNPDGTACQSQDWDSPEGHSFTVVFPGTPPGVSVLSLVNAYWEPISFRLPTPLGGRWTIQLDTDAENGRPAVPSIAAGATLQVAPRSIVIATG